MRVDVEVLRVGYEVVANAMASKSARVRTQEKQTILRGVSELDEE
jgi:hypothetical protein